MPSGPRRLAGAFRSPSVISDLRSRAAFRRTFGSFGFLLLYQYIPSKNSIVLSPSRVTIAFLRSGL